MDNFEITNSLNISEMDTNRYDIIGEICFEFFVESKKERIYMVIQLK